MLDRLRRPIAVVTTVLAVPALAAGTAEARKPTSARLAAFDRCEDLRGYARQAVLGQGAWLPVSQAMRPGDPVVQVAAVSAAAEASEEMSETNAQEAGVDEPDTVKGAGGIVFSTIGGTLRAIDARGAEPVLLDAVELAEHGWRAQLLLRGNRLLVLAPGWRSNAEGSREELTLIEYDVRDPRNLRRVDSLGIEGSYVDARRHGDAVRVITSSRPEPIVLPAPGEGEPYLTHEAAQRAGADLLGSVPLGFLLPDRSERASSGATVTRPHVGCRATRRPAEFSGLSTLTVTTLDLSEGIDPADVDALMADGGDVYASAEGLVVATTRYERPSPTGPATGWDVVTRLHRFTAGTRPVTHYRASGSVAGRLLNQFAMSEHGGVLRVATTERPWSLAPSGDEQASESAVTTLAERDGRLVRLDRVAGLGRGETIHAVRFLGDRGYVVTFRRTDPLYVVDLSDPRRLRVRGELKIPGFSSYLHPVGEDLLLGVGRDADEATGVARGVQVSLFDVADPARPARRAARTFALRSRAPLEWDHHAFTWWGPDRTAFLPISEDGPAGFRGVVGFRVTRAEGLVEAGRLQLPGSGAGVERTIVVGRRLLSLSQSAATLSSRDGLRETGSLPLAARAPAAGPTAVD